jgi:hypothetical protein
MMAAAMRLTPARANLLAFVTAAWVLFVQVLVHRVVSAKLLNNYAFLIISLTMLGFAFSGVVLSFRLQRLLAGLPETLSVVAGLTVLATLGSTVAFYHAEVFQAARTRPEFWLAFARTLPHALLFALPFACAGLTLGLLLASPDLPLRRVYFSDLLGSGVGAFAVIPAISWAGVEGSLLAACAVLLLTVVLVVPPRRPPAWASAAAAAAAILACAWHRDAAFEMRYPLGSMLRGFQQGGSGYRIEAVRWDPIARIEVSQVEPPDLAIDYYPSLIGDDRGFHRRFGRLLTQNNHAFTYMVDYDGRLESLRGIADTIYAAAYQARAVPRPRVGVVGVGGGFDILTALYFDASEVTGIEINAATLSLLRGDYREHTRHWREDPRVRLVAAEGRHHLASHPERYDVLQLSGVDSYSGTPGAAHVFSENYLYTAEAFDLYIDRLTENGILNLMRLEYRPPREMLRALVTAVGALRRAGAARPSDHIVMVTAEPNPNFTALLVKRSPFRPDEVARLRDWAGRSPWFEVSAAPGDAADPASAYRFFLGLDDPVRERGFVRAYPYDVSPASDDRPFFFRHSFWWHLYPVGAAYPPAAPVMEDSTVMLAAAIGLCALACVYLPLRYLTRTAPRATGLRGYGVYFAGTGLGYLAVEIALLQKFGLLLGHPNYALSVVLATLLIASGIGSLLSLRLVGALGGVRFLAYLLSGIILIEYLLLLPRLPALTGAPFAARVAAAAALIAPVGLALGAFLPWGLEALKAAAPAHVPWAWGVNGIFSVLSPVVSIAFCMTWGVGALLLAAVPVYLAAAAALPAPAVARPEPTGSEALLEARP